MANELKLNINLNYLKSSQTANLHQSINVDIAGDEYTEHVQSIGTSEEAVSVVDMTTQGYVYAENLDGTNYVEIGTTGKLSVKLKAGEIGLWRTSGALYAQANTAACRVKFIIIED